MVQNLNGIFQKIVVIILCRFQKEKDKKIFYIIFLKHLRNAYWSCTKIIQWNIRGEKLLETSKH